MDLLHTSGEFRALLLESVARAGQLDVRDAEFLGAWHSVDTPNGESDIEADWRLTGGVLSVLIENKVRAAFQPDQGARYLSRAQGYVTSRRAHLVHTVLVAPERYRRADPAGCAPFGTVITIEQLHAWSNTLPAGSRRTCR